jgi:hypothetical protein
MIRFKAILSSLKSTADGGYRASLDIPENDIAETVKLMPLVGKSNLEVEITEVEE